MKKMTTEQFIQRAKEIHGEMYSYVPTLYNHAKDKVTILCITHGIFKMTPNNHLHNKQGCPVCGDERTRLANKRTASQHTPPLTILDAFHEKTVAVHGNKYDYSEATYINNKTKIKIKCKKHGWFYQTPDQHLNTGTGCPKCSRERYVGGYCEDFFERKPLTKTLPGWLYLAEFADLKKPKVVFYKVGITRKQHPKHRFSGYKGYKINILRCKRMNIYDAFIQEQEFLKALSSYRFFPSSMFKGWTECFRFDSMVLSEFDTFLSRYESS